MTITVSSVESRERRWLEQAVRLATDNVAAGGGPFGAIVVRDGEIIATGTNQVTPTLDPTAHAEIVAIRKACTAIGDFKLTGCVLVSSCEPCPLCVAASLWARLNRVIYAANRDDAAKAGFDDREFYEAFATPREAWKMPVSQLSTHDDLSPFVAWNANDDRVPY